MNYRKEFISPSPVPFALPRQRVPGGSVVLFEEHAVEQRPVVLGMIICLGAGFIFSFLLLTGAVKASDPIYTTLVIGAAVSLPFGLVSFALMWFTGSSIQVIRSDGNLVEVVDTATRSDMVIHRAPIGEWKLVAHPVVVKQKPFGKWTGVALSLELGREYSIVLACQQDEQALQEWLGTAPAWLGRISKEQGEPWIRQGTIRDYLRAGTRR